MKANCKSRHPKSSASTIASIWQFGLLPYTARMILPELSVRTEASLSSKTLSVVPISIAMLLSLSFHIAIILIALVLFKAEFLPSDFNTPMRFEVLLINTNGAREEPQELDNKIDQASQQFDQVALPEIPLESAETIASDIVVEKEKETIGRNTGTSKKEMKLAENSFVLAKAPSPTEVKSTVAKSDVDKKIAESLKQRVDKFKDRMSELSPSSVEYWEIDDRKFEVTVQHRPSENNTLLDRAIVQISTMVGGVEMSTMMQMKRLAFSNYVQIINRWDPDIAFSQDVIDGRFHSNSRIYIAKGESIEPSFSGRVSVSSGVSIRNKKTRKRVFKGGIETGVKKIIFPEDLMDDSSNITTQVLKIAEDLDVTFLSNGDYQWFRLSEPEEIFIQPYVENTRYILAGEGVKVNVCGIVKGSVVVRASEKIVITCDLLYANLPEENPDSHDYLGLISDKYVEIASPEITGRGDLTVYAAIFAKRRFVIRKPRHRTKALLTIVGSLTAGTVSASEPRYSTLLKFDHRFENKRLPGFPVTDKYEREQWDEMWQLRTTSREL
ncbi:MAG: hypothetical protein ACI9CE_003986 [Flavobacterium sp.]|jgi:hypothetical protein